MQDTPFSKIVNAMAVDGYILGILQHGMEVPVAKYCKYAGLPYHADYAGLVIDNNCRMRAGLNWQQLSEHKFILNVSALLRYGRESKLNFYMDIYTGRQAAYLDSLIPLFQEVLTAEVSLDFCNSSPIIHLNRKDLLKWCRLFMRLINGKIKKFDRLNKYILHKVNFPTGMLNIMAVRNGSFFLMESNKGSILYKHAVISLQCLSYYYETFQDKADKWQNTNAAYQDALFALQQKYRTLGYSPVTVGGNCYV